VPLDAFEPPLSNQCPEGFTAETTRAMTERSSD
jgi:hypothetical protein